MIAAVLLDLLFPGRCPGCRRVTPWRICRACWAAIPPVPARAVDPASGIDRTIALGPYDGLLQRAVRQLKFDGRADLARPLGRALGLAWLAAEGRQARLLSGGAGATPPTWVSVPPHRSRLRTRGYDHTALLARAACRASGFGRVLAGAIERVVDTPPLYRLPREERARVLAGAFFSRRVLPGPVILVDDILTTGATAREAASVLRTAGATRVDLLVVARA